MSAIFRLQGEAIARNVQARQNRNPAQPVWIANPGAPAYQAHPMVAADTYGCTMDILTAAEAAAFLQITYEHLGVLRRNASGPPHFNLGRSVRYRREQIENWIAEREVKAA